jgi:1-hydroxy-2-isopentenylcarotenoid 3,4-desaturase
VPKSVAIIGGGIGGLATANRLAKAGFEVTVYEKDSQLGGRAGQKQQDGFTFDTGPSWYLMPGVFERYFAQFDVNVTDALQVKRLSPGYKVFFDGHAPLTITGNLSIDQRTFDKIEPGAGEALTQYVEASYEIYQLALKHFLYTDFTNPRSLIHPRVLRRTSHLINLLRTPLHTYVSRYISHPQLQQVLEYPMVFLGTSPFEAPSMYSLMSALDFQEGVYYPKKGMYSIVELLVKIGTSLGVTYHTDTEILRISHRRSKARSLLLANGETVSHDIMISNADLHFTETQLLAPEAQSYPEHSWHKRQSGISALLMYLGVKGELPNLEHHNLYFVKDWQRNFDEIYKDKQLPTTASMYVSRTSATDPSTAPHGHENLFMLVPLPTGLTLDREALEALSRQYLDAFAAAANIPDLKRRIVSKSLFGPDQFRDRFYAWEGTALGMSHVLKQSALWRIPPRSKKLRNLYYVGANTMPGIGVPMCLISADIVADKLIKRGKRR